MTVFQAKICDATVSVHIGDDPKAFGAAAVSADVVKNEELLWRIRTTCYRPELPDVIIEFRNRAISYVKGDTERFFNPNLRGAEAAICALQEHADRSRREATVAKHFRIKEVISNDPATVVMWADGTKTVVKAQNEAFDPEKGLAMAFARKALGNKHGYYDIFRKYTKKLKAK